MKKINMKSLFAVVAVFATFVAAALASSACLWFLYQPEEPKCLQEK